MKKNNGEFIVIFLTQLLVFYILPMFAATHRQTLGMLVIVTLSTFMLALGLGGITQKTKLKYYYPIFITIIFVPAIQIYSSEFQPLDSLWCLLSATLGITIGDLIMNK